MKYSPFASTKPQAVDTDLEAQKAAFFAAGGKPKVLPAQTFEKDAAENQKYTTIIDGKARNGSRA